ncbi:MAG: inner-rane translocator [Frankiales bacterium]|nr:inner-rane translocator [Frankiales bacterium]
MSVRIIRLVVVAAVIIVIAAVLPVTLNPYYVSIATLTFVHIGLASAWNIAGGMAGQFSLCHSLFVASGGVFSAALVVEVGLNEWLALVAGAGVAALLALLISLLTFRLRLAHLAFALVTLALAEMGLLFVLSNGFLGGASGVVWARNDGIAHLQFSQQGYYWLAFGVMLVICAVAWWVLRSKMGYYLRAIRDDENAAAAVGVNLMRYKTAAMVISAVLTSVAATVYSRYTVFVDPHEVAAPLLSISVILFVVVGGPGTLWGPVIGASLLYPTGELLRGEFGGLTGLHQLIFGVLIVVVVIFMPRGLVNLGSPWLRRIGRSDTPRPIKIQVFQS